MDMTIAIAEIDTSIATMTMGRTMLLFETFFKLQDILLLGHDKNLCLTLEASCREDIMVVER
jgi:hypothetical protein